MDHRRYVLVIYLPVILGYGYYMIGGRDSMLDFLKRWLIHEHGADPRDPGVSVFCTSMADMITSETFTRRFGGRGGDHQHEVDLGLGKNFNHKWRILMATLAETMAAAIAELKKEIGQGGGVTAEQVIAQIHTVVDPVTADVTTLKAQITAILNSEADGATKEAQVEEALKVFTDAFPGAGAAPTPAPEVPVSAEPVGATDAGSTQPDETQPA